MDYAGAIEAFEKALETNPHSAAAHFELGWLYADKVPNAATAIYHYEQFLKLRPHAENAETIKQHIFRLKQDLAKAVLPLPSTPGVQRELEQLAEENRQLKDEVLKWRAYYASHNPASANAPGAGATIPLPNAGAVSSSSGGGDQRSPVKSDPPAATRTHKVQPGETPSAIAKKYGVKVEALLAANPGLNPRRMQVGQSLNLPAR